MPDIRIVPGNAVMSFTSSLNYIERITQDPSGSLTLFGSGSTGRTDLFSIDGNNGRLFSVSDDLSDSLFSVNTVAGLPVIEAFADNTVKIGKYGAEAIVISGSNNSLQLSGSIKAVSLGTSADTNVVVFNTTTKALAYNTGLSLTGATGPIGVTGATGPVGVSGATGVIGVSGATGPIGVTGATGPIGVSGATGVVGVSGATGVVGVSGATGVIGVTGATGVVGVSGATGLTGATGVVGVSGATGLTGATGIVGVSGATGLTGATGVVGVSGATGLTGATGVVGVSGATGVVGVSGATGLTGATGAVGVSGATGVVGVTGATGPVGATGATLSVVNNTNNYVLTATGGSTVNGEANLVFDGTNLGVGTATPGEKLEVNGYILSDRYYPKSSNSTYLVGDTGGLVINGTGYFYSNSSGGSYFQTIVRFRNQIINDTGAYLHLGGGTAGHTYCSGNLGIRLTAPGVGFVNVAAANTSGPTLGSGTVGSQALLSSNMLYGMYSGVSNSGDVWHQVQRNDASVTPYGILLNPNGGGVAIGKGTTSPAHVLDVTGTGNATSDFRAPIFYDSNDTAYYVDPAGNSRLFRLETFTEVRTGNGVAGGPAFSFSGDTNTGMYNAGADTLGFATAGTLRLQITAGGAMGLGITPTNTSGRFEASNDIVAYSTSDRNWKNNIKNIDFSLEKISQINGVEFDWIEDEPFHGNKGHDVGVIAQEIELILPEAVQTRESGMKAVQYDKIIPLLIEAIKELQKQIDELKK